MIKKTVALSAAALLLGGCSQLPFGDGEGSFAEAKSRNAIPASVRAEFDRLDADGDGVIDPSEATSSSEISANFDVFDTNSDGVITLEEYAAGIEKR